MTTAAAPAIAITDASPTHRRVFSFLMQSKLPHPHSTQQSRVIGIDAARAIAVLGMLILHTIPQASIDAVPFLDFFVGSNKPQLLFAVLDGISLSIISSGAGLKSSARHQIAVRGVFLIALGMFLETLGSGVMIILEYYGTYFILMLPFLFMGWRMILVFTVILSVLGPIVVNYASVALEGQIIPGYLQAVFAWTINGQYPAIVWMAYVLLGFVVARCGLRSARTGRIVLFSGGISLVAGVILLLCNLADPWEYMIENACAGGMGLVVTWTLVRLCGQDDGDHQVMRWWRSLLAFGVAPLSVYVLHVYIIAIIGNITGLQGMQSVGTFFTVTITCQIVALVWLLRARRGPVEQVSHWLATPPRRSEL